MSAASRHPLQGGTAIVGVGASRLGKFKDTSILTLIGEAVVAALDDAGVRALFQGSPVKRIGRDRFVRNVLVAIGNSADVSLIPSAQGLLRDADPVVAEAASWALRRLLPC